MSAFLIAPILLFIATTVASERTGITVSVWICLALAGFGGAAGGLLFFLGGSGPQTPDLEAWQHDEPA